MSSGPKQVILEASGIMKRFPGALALRGVSFNLQAAEIHALCGENGAGKSTLIKILAGVHPAGAFDGLLNMEGKPVTFRGVAEAETAGVAVIHQELALVPELSVAENIFLGREPTRAGLINWLTMHEQARRLLAALNLPLDPAACVRDLGVAQQQLVEIAKALSKQPRVLILDEPSSALADHEVQRLLETLGDLRRRGVSCIYVSHRLDEVFAIADRITVLRDGQSVVTLDIAQCDRQTIIRHMVGREITELFPERHAMIGRPRLVIQNLDVDDLDGRPALRGLSLELHAGEVLGIGGLMGAGRSELLLHLIGAWGRRMGGEVQLDGAPLAAVTPRAAIDRGLVLVSEDRKRYGLIPEQSVGFNLALSSLSAVTRGNLIDRGLEFRRNQNVIDALRIRAAGQGAPARSLSGGNQQKVVLGKALLVSPKVVLLDEPTRGIDIGAKVEIYELIRRLASEGKAVMLVSSELPELMGMSDRIVMLHKGTVGGVFDRTEATQERLLAAATGQRWNG
jgi:D-xylose transport system ATP-binding protein